MKAIISDQKQPVYKADMIIVRAVGKQLLLQHPLSYSVIQPDAVS